MACHLLKVTTLMAAMAAVLGLAVLPGAVVPQVASRPRRILSGALAKVTRVLAMHARPWHLGLPRPDHQRRRGRRYQHRLDIETLTNPYEDPHHRPPADIWGPDARAYEEKIVELLRERLLPNSGQVKALRSIELRVERPDTEIIFRYTDARDRAEHARGAALWRDSWPTDGAAEYGRLHDPASVAGWLLVAWQAGELEAIDSA